MARVRQALLAALALPIALSCASILGIEEAQLKPDTTGDDAGVGTTAHPNALCDQYCAAVMKNCTGPELEQYPSVPYCLAVCPAMPQGTRADTRGNTVGCRLRFAEAAGLGERTLSCGAAGPGGNGLCGENCESWCTLEHNICPDVYATDQDCLDACKTFPVEGKYNDSDPIQSGNKFECRLYHVTAAAGFNNPGLHCPHTDITIVKPPCIGP
jgi:hypothetical protein